MNLRILGGVIVCSLTFLYLKPSVAYGGAVIWEGKLAGEILSRMLANEPFRGDFEFGTRNGARSCILHIDGVGKELRVQCELNMEVSPYAKMCENLQERPLRKIQVRDIVRNLSPEVKESILCWRPLAPYEEAPSE